MFDATMPEHRRPATKTRKTKSRQSAGRRKALADTKASDALASDTHGHLTPGHLTKTKNTVSPSRELIKCRYAARDLYSIIDAKRAGVPSAVCVRE